MQIHLSFCYNCECINYPWPKGSWTSKHEDAKPGKHEVKLYDDEHAVAVRKVETPE